MTKVIESPYEALHDTFYEASIDSGDCHAVIFRQADDAWEFTIIETPTDREVAKSGFHFSTLSEAQSRLEQQVPHVSVRR